MHPDRSISTPYIHALAPRIVEYLYSDQSKQVENDLELSFTLECISTIEALIALTESKNRKFFSFINMTITSLLYLLYFILIKFSFYCL